MRPKVLGAAIGQCVHVAGLDHFLRMCEMCGWIAVSMGPAVTPETLVDAIKKEKPDLVAVSYRLTAHDLAPLLQRLRELLDRLPRKPRIVFGGTPPCCEVADKTSLFAASFDGTRPESEVLDFIRGKSTNAGEIRYPDTLVSRIEWADPFPLIRHHYGEPDVDKTIIGAAEIADSGALDVLSIGPDQNAQEHFFHPSEMDPRQHGAGGVPIRTPGHLKAIYDATRKGNFPLVRCYSGTDDLIPWAKMALETIHNAWGAIPLCWYSVMDGRSKVPFPDAIADKQRAMKFYAEQGVPLEVNESHQWSLRDAHDSLAVTMAFLGAYNAKKQGVRHYVIQMMHNTPPSTSPAMDLAKMLAKLQLIHEIEDETFTTFREVRAGITSLPSDFNEAKGHMAASTIYSMALRPHIVHVVGYSESSHVVDPDTLIESCFIARGAIRLALKGAPDMAADPAVIARKDHLVKEARVLLAGLRQIGRDTTDPWSDPETITGAIRTGVLDAPHFRGNPHLCGRIITAPVRGGWEAIDPESRSPVYERERLHSLGIELKET